MNMRIVSVFSTAPLLLAGIATAQTTVLPFDGVTTPNLLRGYGDRVTGPSSGGFPYGGTGTFTPNVEVTFGSMQSGQARELALWNLGYNDLVNVVYAPISGAAGGNGELTMTLLADPGHRVTLHSFDVGNWGIAITLPYVRVHDQNGAVVFEELSVALAPSTSPNERNFVFTPPLVGQTLSLRLSLDGLGGLADNVGLDNVTFGQQAGAPLEIGATYCSPAVANSGTWPARMRLWGQPTVAANDVRLVATSLPFSSFGFFLTSRTQGNIANPGGSQGNLCLGGAIGRYVGPGQIQNSEAFSTFHLDIDLTTMPSPTGSVVAQVGETWNFTAWYRDAIPTSTSNFTDAVSLLLQ